MINFNVPEIKTNAQETKQDKVPPLIPLISVKFPLSKNTASYLSEFLSYKEIVEFSFTNRKHLNFKYRYFQIIKSCVIKADHGIHQGGSNRFHPFSPISHFPGVKKKEIHLQNYFSDKPDICLQISLLKKLNLFKNLISLSFYRWGDKLEIEITKNQFFLENLKEFKILFCDFKFIDLEKILFSIFSSKNLETIVIKSSNISEFGVKIVIDFLEHQNSLKNLSLENCGIKFSQIEQKKLLLFLKIKSLDLSGNQLDFNQVDFIFTNLNNSKNSNLKELRIRNCKFQIPMKLLDYITKQQYGKLQLFDMSENTLVKNLNKNFLINTLDEVNKKKTGKFIVIYEKILEFVTIQSGVAIAMLLSRSGVYINRISDPKNLINNRVLGKFIGKKPNGAILPQLIYDTASKIELSRDQLIEILRLENNIRLSDEAKDEFDNINTGPIFSLLKYDQNMIITALKRYGFNPDEDDSLKAYHLATTKFIHDEEVRQSVVWMKYDKSKVGDYYTGDTIEFQDIKLYDLNEKVCFLQDLISIDRPNLIVSGSMS